MKISYDSSKFGGHRYCGSREIMFLVSQTPQKMKFSIKIFFSKCDQIHSFLLIWSHLMKKSLMENFFCTVLRYITRSHDQRFMKLYGWKLLIICHYSGKFGSHKHCSCDDMFLVIKRQDSTCFYSNLPLIFFSIAHDMKVCGMLCSVLVTRIKSNDKWSNRENFSRLIQKYRREGNRKKKTRSCWRLTRLHFELSSLIL